jgi:tetratricopeptide (TPR) repeat protein
MPERLARAALGYGGRFVWSSSDDDRLVPLLEEALGAVGDDLRPLRVRLLARLACALGRTGSMARTASLSREAVELARGLDDRDALAWALVARRVVLWGPDNIDELLALSSEIVALVEEIGDWEQGVNAHTLRLELLLTLGDLAGVRADLGAATRLAEELRLPSHRWHVAVHEVELALLEGRFADAEHHVEQALEFGERAHRAQAIECAVTQRFLLRLEQGRLEELRPALERLAAEGPEAKISLCLLARLECEHDEARARSILDSLAPDDFAGVPRDSDWLLAIALLAEVAVSLRDAARSATLYELLAPYAGLSAGAAHHFNVGSASRYLGLLAASLSRLDDAARHFEDALATNERIGARPWLAHTKHDYARMLLERGASGDRERAGRLLEDCLDTCRELGMPALERRAEDLIEAARSPAASPRPASGAVFVGRQRELGELLGGLDDALAGRGGLFLLAGEPGIGKSRLADELTARARERGAQVLVGRCWEAGGAPAYWPWVQALRGYVRGCDAGLLRSQLGAGAGDVAQLLPELNDLFPDLPLPPSLDPEGARFRLFDSTASFLRVAAERQPFVLVLDDLHAADVPSLLLLEFVAGQLVELRMMLVGAYRDVDPTLRDPLSASLAELSRYPATHFLALAGLTLADLETADSSLRVRLLARLAGALRDQHDREPRARLSSEAVEMARRIGEPATLAYALDGRCSAVMWPENSEERIAIGTELAHVAEETGDQERVLAGRYYRLFALFELGDMPAVQADLEACARLTEQLHQPAQLWLVVVTRATLALFEGRFTEAEALIEEALTLGERAQGSDAVMSYRIQRFALHREQGELERMEAVISRSIEEYPRRPMFRCMLAVLYSETGRDERAKAVFEELASDDFAALPSRNEWLFSMGFLAEVAHALGDAKRAASMYELLLPYAERNAVTPDYIATGAVARYLGLLAAVLGRFDDAGRHFEAALELNERMGARPWLAHTQHDYARMLLEREAPGDRERAGELFQACLVTCRELGMPVLEQKTAALAESASART